MTGNSSEMKIQISVGRVVRPCAVSGHDVGEEEKDAARDRKRGDDCCNPAPPSRHTRRPHGQDQHDADEDRDDDHARV